LTSAARIPRAAVHAGALALLFALGLLVHHDDLTCVPLQRDEVIFGRAFAHAERGASPYAEPGFYYPPPFAVLGAQAFEALGERRFFLLLRHLNLLGACVVAWLAVAATRWRRVMQWGLAALVVAFAFPVVNALGLGNVSLIAIALTLAALALAPERPIAGGLLLGVGLAFKPLAIAAVPLLAVAGWKGARGALRTALVAVMTAGTLVLTFGGRFALEIWQRAEVAPTPNHDLSLGRVLRGFGLPVEGRWLFFAVVAIAALCLARRRLEPRDEQAAILVGTLWSLPIVWAHTLLLALPVQALALERALAPAPGGQRRRWVAVALVGAAIVSLNAHTGTDAAPENWPPPLLALLGFEPLACVLGLLLFSLGERRGSPTHESPSSG